MARFHYDLHYITADYIDKALKLLLDAGLISVSRRDKSLSSVRSFERFCPEKCAILKVRSFY